MKTLFARLFSSPQGVPPYQPRCAISFAYLLMSLALFDCGESHATQRDLFSLSLEELMQVSVQVVSRQPESLETTPAAVTVFTREDIERMGVRWLDELMSYIPGAFPHQRAGSAAPFWSAQFRGNPNENGSGILLLIDGRRQNDAAFGTASTAWMRQNLAGFERVEIMRSPGSALYGANAAYAVINLISANDLREVKVSGGELGATELQLSAQTQLDEWQVSINAYQYRDDGDKRAAFDRFFEQSHTVDPQQSQSFQLHLASPRLSLFVDSYQYTLENYYVLGTLTDGTNQSNSNAFDYGIHLHDITWRDIVFGAMLNQRRSEYQLTSRLTPANTGSNTTPQDFIFQSTFFSETNSIDVTSTGNFNVQNRWQLGIETYEEKASAEANATHDVMNGVYLGNGLVRQPYDLMPNARRTGFGYYSHWASDWTEHISSTVGVRHDETDDVGGATSPRIALIYRGIDAQIWKMAYVEAFRAPSLGELHLTSNPVNLGNDDLKPVRLKNLELTNLLQGKSTSLETSLFYSHEQDLILFRQVSPTTVQRFNVGELSIKGMEFSLHWRTAPDLEIGLLGSHIFSWNQNYGDAVGVTDASTVVPRDLATITLDFAYDKWRFHIASHYVSGVAVNQHSSAYALGRFNIVYRTTPDQRLSLSVSNLFDTTYDTTTDSAGIGAGNDGQLIRSAPQRGRQLLLSWTWNPEDTMKPRN